MVKVRTVTLWWMSKGFPLQRAIAREGRGAIFSLKGEVQANFEF